MGRKIKSMQHERKELIVNWSHLGDFPCGLSVTIHSDSVSVELFAQKLWSERNGFEIFIQFNGVEMALGIKGRY
jgi:hypothetical protein